MFESFGGQSEVDHSSHRNQIRCPVVGIRRGFASEQTREIVLVCVHAQDFPTLTPPDTVQDKMFSRLNCFATFAKVRLHRFDVVQVPIRWCHACAELREDARLSLGEVVVHASSVLSRPCSVDSAQGCSDSRGYLLGRSPQAFLCPLNHAPGQSWPTCDHPFLVR